MTLASRRPMAALALGTGLVAVALAGCGSPTAVGGDDESSAVRSAVRAWSAAIATEDGARACVLMSPAAQRQLVGSQQDPACPAAARRLAASLGPDGRAGVRALAVRSVDFPADGRAVAVLDTAGQRLALRRDGGRWLIDDLAGTLRRGGAAYPPPPTSFGPSPAASR